MCEFAILSIIHPISFSPHYNYVLCYKKVLGYPCICVCKANYVHLVCRIAFCNFCLPVGTEMLCLMRKGELSVRSTLFEHVQCAIMLDHLFLLRGWQVGVSLS